MRDLLVVLGILGLDQSTKAWVLWAYTPWGWPVEVTPFFDLVLVWNTGVSFGLFQGNDAEAQRWALAGLALLVSVGLAWWLRTGEHGRLQRWGIVLVIAGAVGNAIDRVVHGAVVDFLDFHVAGWHWPAFNVADSSIVVGAALLILDGLWAEKPTST
ncbi:MAG: signal peptidase II [Pseudomonadota bacterium]